jgi:uncharacterized membrane protein
VTDRRLRHLTAGLALLGAGIASYLLFERYTGGTVACSFGNGCETVQRSRYAEVLGVPVALLGLVAYAGVLALAWSRSHLAHAATLAVSLAALAFSAYLVYAQIILVGAICQWCIASDAVVTAIAAAAALRLRAQLRPPIPSET